MMPDPARLAQLLAERERVEQMMTELQLAERRQNLAWAPILCSCERRYQPGEPGMGGCIIYGMIVMRPDGTIL